MARLCVPRSRVPLHGAPMHAFADFLVDSSALTNITFDLPRSFAGSIATDSPGHPNNTLFFWAVEKTDGSLTGNATADEPWLIWLNGGCVACLLPDSRLTMPRSPGSSSFLGFFFEVWPTSCAARPSRAECSTNAERTDPHRWRVRSVRERPRLEQIGRRHLGTWVVVKTGRFLMSLKIDQPVGVSHLHVYRSR